MPFQIEINGRVVKGFIDRLERTKEGEYCVIDFKTGSKSENGNTIKEDIQMNVYALAVLKKYGKLPVRASLYYIKTNETVDYVPDNDVHRRAAGKAGRDDQGGAEGRVRADAVV